LKASRNAFRQQSDLFPGIKLGHRAEFLNREKLSQRLTTCRT